uniref:Uncharacterized protein n=1 Tax=viral metagenome TaxID=1070528 RepID=A0A6M3LSN2_9ZZZZ
MEKTNKHKHKYWHDETGWHVQIGEVIWNVESEKYAIDFYLGRTPTPKGQPPKGAAEGK